MNNYTTYHALEKIKYNIIDVYAEHLRYTVQDKTEEEKICALGVFVGKIRLIKDLAVLTRISKKYRRNYET